MNISELIFLLNTLGIEGAYKHIKQMKGGGAKLVSADGYALQDKNGNYLITEEA